MSGLDRLTRGPQAPKHLGFFRWREVGGDVLLTNAVGDWVFVAKDEHAAMLEQGCDPTDCGGCILDDECHTSTEGGDDASC